MSAALDFRAGPNIVGTLLAGNHTSAKSYLATFVTQVQTGSGTTINSAYASLLVNWAQDLIARL